MRALFLQGGRQQGEGGLTLIEVTLAAVILAVIVFGAVAFLMSGRSTAEHAGKERVAIQVATDQLEQVRSGSYDAIGNDSGEVTYDSTTYAWDLTVTTLRADPSDPESSYKQAEITVDWPMSNGRPVVLRTAISR